MKKALVISSVASMIEQFNMPNIKLLIYLGYEVHVSCNFHKGNTCTKDIITDLKQRLVELGCKCHQIGFERDIKSISKNFKAFKQIKKLLNEEKYDLIHCQSPIGGLLTRMAANKFRKYGVKVVYTAHGFHFYKGAPLINWILYYPVEWVCSHWTDVLITINKEDYRLAHKHMRAKRVEYIPGVGIDLSKYQKKLTQSEKDALRKSLCVTAEDKLLLSVGELNRNKNHEAVIRAIASLEDKNIHYVVAGQGELDCYLKHLSEELGVGGRVHLLGYRNDIPRLCQVADLYVHPSFREGLPVSVMEAMASGIPCIGSDIRGVRDLLLEEDLFEPKDITKLTTLLLKYCGYNDNVSKKEKGRQNAERSAQYDIKIVSEKLNSVYNAITHNK